jgi:DNA helicase HerA-like ATPase
LHQDTKVVTIDFTGEWKKKMDPSKYELITKDTIENYLTNTNGKVGLFELPSLSNTTDVLKETQTSIEKIFNYAKKKYDEDSPIRVALVLEEAHTITPETNFLGDMGDYGGNKALVNKMTQVALQGRKYGVGLLVIAQRTANVSKTVLTQCNTVICFQAFDETSFSFLGNYVGKDMVQALPNLKQYHAVVAGKAVRSNMPMIIDLKR